MLVLRPEAKADLEEARDWYENQHDGLGLEFFEEIDAAFGRIESNPQLYAKIHGDVRRVFARRFPYAVYFIVEANRTVVIGVLHQRRSPAVWQTRFGQ